MKVKIGKITWYDRDGNCGLILGYDDMFYRIQEFTVVHGELLPDTMVEFELVPGSAYSIVLEVRTFQSVVDKILRPLKR